MYNVAFVNMNCKSYIERSQVVFWDFDGVIKDSIEVKSDAFEMLFSSFGRKVVSDVRIHHEKNGGVSRYEKIPLYLSWVDQTFDNEQVEQFFDRFSELVREGVLSSPWVKGVREYLDANYKDQTFILVTATPEEEIIDILEALRLKGYFREIHGAPKRKQDVVCDVLNRWRLRSDKALFIGDSVSDWKAATKNGVNFLLRRTSFNLSLQKHWGSLMFDDLNDE